MEKKNKNHITFGLGTVGRDMVYTMISMYLMFYLTDVLQLNNQVLWWVTAIIMGARIFDAFNDPFMGVIVDNTHSRFGKFKPWICVGSVLTAILSVLLFTDFGFTGNSFIVSFGIIYILYSIYCKKH